jgi:hypothetical protein
LLESKGEFTCSNGELTTHTQSQGVAIPGVFGLWYAGTVSQSLSFTITTNKYLQVKLSGNEAGVVVWGYAPFPVLATSSVWLYFKPMEAGQQHTQHSQSEAEGPLIFITTMSDIEAALLEKVATAAFASHRYTLDNLKAEQADFTVAINMEIKYGEFRLGRGAM